MNWTNRCCNRSTTRNSTAKARSASAGERRRGRRDGALLTWCGDRAARVFVFVPPSIHARNEWLDALRAAGATDGGWCCAVGVVVAVLC